ncbi:GPP34 family phosphoprotein [Streptomyces sp. L-9-10]|uniref:GOLPH3/VPS74 family protein n=1 Tax=Streptomyces sp. L-9-10 TaxID=1478131 RepID=UPI00101D85B2|nr:GPP34 family phosphoprotein [Streptomyces sp. L-9-10]
MTTARDLMITAMDVAPDPPAAGELSLALAGAELIDLLAAEAIRLDGDRIVPGHRPAIADRLLDQAAESLAREAPYETVADWLWRRGLGLAPAYLSALETDGQLTRRRRGLLPFRTGRTALVDSPDRRLAGDRWASKEPVLVALATAVGIRDGETDEAPDTAAPDTEAPDTEAPDTADDAVETVLVAVNEALLELEAVRQRRSIEQDAFDNVWRGY